MCICVPKMTHCRHHQLQGAGRRHGVTIDKVLRNVTPSGAMYEYASRQHLSLMA